MEAPVHLLGGRERVEYAIKFPADGDQVLLPIDSKFPHGDAGRDDRNDTVTREFLYEQI